MSDIRLRMRRPGLTGPTKAIGTVSLTPVRAWGPARGVEVATGVLLPDPLQVTLTTGTDTTVTGVEPCDGTLGWCWQVTTVVAGRGVIDQRHVLVPAAGVHDIEDLVVVAPDTLRPVTHTPSWDVLAPALAAIQQAVDMVPSLVAGNPDILAAAAALAQSDAGLLRDRGALTAENDLGALDDGVYNIRSTSAASALGLPTPTGGILTQFGWPAGASQTWTTAGTIPQLWARSRNTNGDWLAWQRIDGLEAPWKALPYANANQVLVNGFYAIADASGITNLPDDRPGTFVVFRTGSTYFQLKFSVSESGGPLIWTRAFNGSVWSAWDHGPASTTDLDLDRHALEVADPVNLVRRPGYSPRFDGWPVTTGAITVAPETDPARQRTSAAVRVTMTDPNTGTIDSARFRYRAPAGRAPKLTMWVYLDTPPSYSLRVYLSPVSGFTRYVTAVWPVGPSNYVPGWTKITINPDEWSITGATSWAEEMRYLRIRLSNAGATPPIVVTVDDIHLGEISDPRLLIQFDDARESVYTTAFPYMRERGIPGTMYVVPTLVGEPGFLTLPQLEEMRDAGWDIASHGYSHINYSNYDKPTIAADMQDAADWLVQHGFSRGAMHLATPFGIWTPDVAEAAQEVGLKTLRVTNSTWTRGLSHDQVDLQHLWILAYPLMGAPVAPVISRVDQTVAAGRFGILLFHAIMDTPTDTYDWSTESFRALIDHIWDNVLDGHFTTISRYWAEATR